MKKLRLYLKDYPHVRAICVIIALLVLSFVFLFFDFRCPTFSSINANVFAGLLTGLIITLVGSFRNKSQQDIQMTIDFFEMLRDQFLKETEAMNHYFISYYHSDDNYLKNLNSLAIELEHFDDIILDADHTLSAILKRTPQEYFVYRFGYDAEMSKNQYVNINKHTFLSDVFDDDTGPDERDEIHGIILNALSSHQRIANVIGLTIRALERKQKELYHLYI